MSKIPIEIIMKVAEELYEVLEKYPELDATDRNVALHTVLNEVCNGAPKLHFINGVTSLVSSGMDLNEVAEFSESHRLRLEK